jgi:hypothetical protein
MKSRLNLSLFLSCVVALCAAGCGGEKVNRPPVFKVTGKVTFSGKPVVNADVTFIHDETKRAAFGKTNEEGVYKLTTFNANDGAVEGKHSIKVVDIPPPASTPALADTESAEYKPPGIGEDTMPKPKSNLPAKYADAATSGLFGVVNADGTENVIDLELKP